MPRPTDEDDDDYDRPRRRPRRDEDDDDYDDRPRRKKKAKKGGGSGMIVAAVGGGLVLLVGLAVGGYLLLGKKGGGGAGGGGVAGGPAGAAGEAPPPGYSAVGDAGIGIRLYLPGQVQGSYVRVGGPQGPPDPNSYAAHEAGGPHGSMMSALRTPGFTPGQTPDQLFASYEKSLFRPHLRKSEVTGKRPVTLGGRPGLEIGLKELPDLWDDTPEKADFFKDKNREEKERVAKEGMFYVVLVVGHGEWTYVIAVARKLAPPDPETVKTVSGSIKFG